MEQVLTKLIKSDKEIKKELEEQSSILNKILKELMKSLGIPLRNSLNP